MTIKARASHRHQVNLTACELQNFILEFLIAVGCEANSYRPAKTELLSKSNVWSTEADYPNGEDGVCGHAIVAQDDRFILFGGSTSMPWHSNSVDAFS